MSVMKTNIFGKRLKELRTERKLSQQKLGDELGFCNQTISFWESGRCEPDYDSLVKIAEYFAVSSDFLLGLSDI